MNDESLKQTMIKISMISKLHREAFEKNVSSLGVHQSQHRLLMYLSRCKETPKQKDISEHFKVSPAAIAVSLKKLEKGGFIEKSSGTDARANKIIITDKGKDIVKASRNMFKDVDKNVFSSINEDELKAFNATLDMMMSNLENISEGEI